MAGRVHAFVQDTDDQDRSGRDDAEEDDMYRPLDATAANPRMASVKTAEAAFEIVPVADGSPGRIGRCLLHRRGEQVSIAASGVATPPLSTDGKNLR
jgi:hypothetical protein